MIYVTPYDQETKQCTAASCPVGDRPLETAASTMFPNHEIITQSKRLVLLKDMFGAIAVSDYAFKVEAPCS